MHEPAAAPNATLTATGVVLSHDASLAELLGTSSLDGQRIDAFARTREDAERLLACLQTVADGGTAGHAHLRMATGDGTEVWAQVVITPSPDDTLTLVVIDDTARVEAEHELARSERRSTSLLRNSADIVFTAEPDGTVTSVTSLLPRRLGWATEYVIGRPGLDFAHQDDRERVHAAWQSVATGDRSHANAEVRLMCLDGTVTWSRLAVSDLRTDPDVQSLIGTLSDITAHKQEEARHHLEQARYRARFDHSRLTLQNELRRSAEHDELTGLLNRSTLLDHLRHPEKLGTAVMFIDLDHFKDVNDGHDHTAGDAVLVEVAGRLRSTLAPHDIVARFGGDEFVVVLHGVDEHVAQDLAHQVLDALSMPFRIGEHVLRIGATIGISLAPAASAEDLLRFADTAMYAAKASGRGRVRVFDQTLADQAEERYVLGAELVTALDADALQMSYQPVIDIRTGEVVGVEALARWAHPGRGDIPPSRFVPLAELSGSSGDLDRWVVGRTMNEVAAMKAEGVMPQTTRVAINLSGQSLTEGLDEFIVESAARAGLDPETITLEITESAVMADKDVAITVLQRLRDHGLGIAIDDFGMGYSSMAYLRDLPITVLKIDRGFVQGIPDDAHSLAIVTSLTEIARSLGLTVVAEGVETPAHLAALRSRGCTLAQGWLWSAACSPAELRATGVLTKTFQTGPATSR